MTTRHTMQQLAEPLRIECCHGNTPGPAEGGKRRTGAQPLTSSTSGMLDGGEGTTRHRTRQPCISPFAHDDQARRAQSSRGPVDRPDNANSPMSSVTQVRDPLDQHINHSDLLEVLVRSNVPYAQVPLARSLSDIGQQS